MTESSDIAEKSLSEDENSPESCLINMLRNDISGKLVINDDSTMNYMNDVRKVPAAGHYIEKYQDDEEDEDDEEDGDDFSDEELLSQMGYGKSEPKRVIKKEVRKQCSDDDEEDENLLEESLLAQMGYLKKEPPKHEPISTPTAALNLISALKGSCEKEGKQARECRVSWGPDVYDPPLSNENFSTTNTQSHKSAHKVKGLAGKNRQKMGGKGVGGPEDGGGDGSKGSKVGGNKGIAVVGGKAAVKYKDRKQVKKKHGGSVSKYSTFDDC
ncbi:uncharacterized protein [Henckelia pumila]|uniref:uncharacterized protein n=1 Tax=Henckelia pumila TaxID=405737 RepID=UPI003C6E4508